MAESPAFSEEEEDDDDEEQEEEDKDRCRSLPRRTHVWVTLFIDDGEEASKTIGELFCMYYSMCLHFHSRVP